MGGLSFGMDMSMNMGGGFSLFAFGRPTAILDAAHKTLNGSDAASLIDQSGDSNDAAQGTPSLQPGWNASSANFNGQPSLGFTGSQWMSTAAFTGGTISQPITAFIVYKFATVAAGAHALMGGRTSGNRLHPWKNAADFQLFAGAGLSIWTETTDPHIGVFLSNGASSTGWRDGVAGSVGNAGTNPLDGITVGAALLGAGSFMTGEIAYIGVYPFEATTDHINYNANYLSARFGPTWTDI